MEPTGGRSVQIQLPVLGLTPWPWKWGLPHNLIDAWRHVVFAAGTVVAWALRGQVG